MIELRTGVPGSGKTLSMVAALYKLINSWDKKPEEGRPIFVHNIKDLALAHSALPLKLARIGGKEQQIPDWDAIPDGSLIIIDECQDLFPPRSSQSAAPDYIAWFNTHRHKGMDLWLTTQHPKLIDFSIRALVGKHMHFRRLFGGQRAACYEWDACSDNLSGLANAVMSHFEFPKNAFQFYKSAEIHTKQSFRLPRWLVVPVIGVAISVFAIPRAYSVIKGTTSGHGLSEATGKPLTQALGSAQAASAALGAVSAPVLVALKPKGCIQNGDKCACLDQTGWFVKSPIQACQINAQEFKGPLS